MQCVNKYFLVLLFFMSPIISNAGLCQKSIKQAKTTSGFTISVHTEECLNSDKRTITISTYDKTRNKNELKRITQKYSESETGGAHFIDLEKDGIPEVELTGICGAGPNCEQNIYKIRSNGKSIIHYYSGGYFDIKIIKNYLVASSRDSCCSWNYIVYDLSKEKHYPFGEKFQYSVYIEATDLNDTGDVTESKCRILSSRSEKNRALAHQPAKELLKFCEHYGKNYKLTSLP